MPAERFPYPWHLSVPPPIFLSSLPNPNRVQEGVHQDPRVQDKLLTKSTAQQFIPSQLTCIEPKASHRRTTAEQKKYSTTMMKIQTKENLKLLRICRAPFLLCRLRAYADPNYQPPAQVPIPIIRRTTYQLSANHSPRTTGLELEKACMGFSHWFAGQCLREPKTVHDNHGIRSEVDRQLIMAEEFILRVGYNLVEIRK